MQNIHGSSPLTIYVYICHHLSKCHWNYRARMHKHEKKYEKHTASKTEVGSVARRQLAWKPELEKAEPPLTGKTLSSSLQTGLPHGFSLHPLGRGFLSAQHLPPILPKVCLTWSCLNTSRQYCLPASAYMSSRMHVLQALAQEVVPCY